MELTKKKYLKAEVETIISELTVAYESRLKDGKARITELLEENTLLKAELDEKRRDENAVKNALIASERSSAKILKEAEITLSLALKRVEKLNAFVADYLKSAKECDAEKADDIKKTLKAVKKILSSDSGNVEKADKIHSLHNGDGSGKLKTGKRFNPKKKIEEFISSSDGGFNMDEILNPGELELEALCKELGLMGK